MITSYLLKQSNCKIFRDKAFEIMLYLINMVLTNGGATETGVYWV